MRAFGIEISGNARSARGYRKKLTPAERAAIITARLNEVPRKELAEQFDCSVTAISRTFKRCQLRNSVKSASRSGRPRKISPQQARYIRQMVKRNPRMSWAALLGQCPVRVVKNTLRKVLGKSYLRKFRALKRIALDEAKAASRLQHAKDLRSQEAMLMEVGLLVQRV